MENNTKKTSGNLFSIGNIITVVLVIAVIIGYAGSKNNWFRFVNIQGDKSVEFSSVEQLTNSIDYQIKLPDFVNSAIVAGSDPVGTVKNRNFTSFTVDNTLIGTCKFVGYGVDPLGLKDTILVEDDEGNLGFNGVPEIYRYSVENSSVDYIEYIYNLPEFENCTLIIWSDNSVNYSMLFGDKVTEEVILENWDIEKSDISEFVVGGNSDNSDTDTTDNDINSEIISSEHISIALPSDFEPMESDGYVVYSLNGKMLIAVMYTEESIASDNFTGSGEISVADNIVLRYSKDNPFSEGTRYYSTYNKVLESIGKIAGSVEYKN